MLLALSSPRKPDECVVGCLWHTGLLYKHNSGIWHLCWKTRTKDTFCVPQQLVTSPWSPWVLWVEQEIRFHWEARKEGSKKKSGINKEEPDFGGVKHKVIYMMQTQKVVKLVWTMGRWRKTLALKFTFLSSKLQLSKSWLTSPPSSYAPNVPGGKKPTTQNIWIRFNLKMGIWLFF